MIYLFPIAGRGSRFLEKANENSEYKKPKPLIDIKGKPMIQRAVEAFPISSEDKLVFVVRKEHVEEYNIDVKLKEIFKTNTEIVVQDTPPEGAAKTVLLAKKLINNSQPLLITDSDFILEGKKYFDKIQDNDPDFAFPTFYSENPRSSFAKINEKGFVTETAEKKKISTNAIIGSYYFKEGRDFVFAAEKMIKEDVKVGGEFYISPSFNYLVQENKKGILINGCKLVEMGTPELLEESRSAIE
jgi:dTDP-glucose pyrophosphorylase